MPKSSSADFVTDWETLLKNVSDAAAELPNMDVYKAALDQSLAGVKDGLALSQSHRGLKQQQTKDLRELIGKGKDAAINLRSAIKAHFGPRSEILLKFGMTPIRKRKKAPVQAAQTAKEPEPEPERVVIAQPPLDRIVYHGRTIAVYPAAGVDWKSLINIRIFETLRPGMNFAEARARLGPPNLASRNHMGPYITYLRPRGKSPGWTRKIGLGRRFVRVLDTASLSHSPAGERLLPPLHFEIPRSAFGELGSVSHPRRVYASSGFPEGSPC